MREGIIKLINPSRLEERADVNMMKFSKDLKKEILSLIKNINGRITGGEPFMGLRMGELGKNTFTQATGWPRLMEKPTQPETEVL